MKRWQLWLGVAISAAGIALALSQVKDWSRFGHAFTTANYWYLVPMTASYFLVMFLRSVRWRSILNQVGRVRLRSAWISILVCYMGNNVFPLRAGELMRVFLIGKQEPHLSMSSALATVVVERLFDFLTTLVFLGVVLLTVPFPEKHQELAGLVRQFGMATVAGTLVLLTFLVLLHARTEFALRIGEKLLRPLPERWRRPVLEALRRFAGGLVIIGRPRALLTVLGMGFLIWFVNLAPVALAGLAFDVRIPFTGTLFVMVVGAAAASIPAAPGFFGIFHYFTQQALMLILDLDPETALSIAVLIHACYYFPMVVAGAIAAWREGYSLTRLREEAASGEPAGDP